jgi:hypothetical protein
LRRHKGQGKRDKDQYSSGTLFAVEVARAKFPFPRKGWQAKPDGVGFQGNDYAEKKIKPWRYRQKSVELDKTCVFIKAAVLNMPFINFCRRHQSWIFLMKKAATFGWRKKEHPAASRHPSWKEGNFGCG